MRSAGFVILVAMSRYTGEQRAFCVRAFYENAQSYVTVRRLYRAKFELRRISECPSTNLIKQWIERFERTGSTQKMRPRGGQRVSRTDENIQRVRESVRANPRMSERKRSSTLGVTRSTLQRILRLDLKLHPYKIQLVQELKATDFESRLRFANEMRDKFSNFNNILFSDEAHFYLNGFLNKQNCRYWAAENPRLKHQKPLHSPKVTVWAAIAKWGIIGPYFFENNRGQAVTVNSERYTAMLRSFLIPTLQESRGYTRNTWFQQDGATCHTSNESIEVVREMFPQKLISRRGDISWPPRSPDLTPADFFLWGYLKSRVYSNNPTNLQQLKLNIRQEMESISRETLTKVFQNFDARLEECSYRQGRHLDDVVFKK